MTRTYRGKAARHHPLASSGNLPHHEDLLVYVRDPLIYFTVARLVENLSYQIWNKAKTAPSEYYHIPFKDVRKGLDGEYIYCEDWTDAKAPRISYQPYNPITRESKQLYYCQFYRPGEGTYPLPDYVGALKYIEVDTEISNYYLNSIKNGFTAQTHIQLFKGIPTPEEARATARRSSVGRDR